MKKKKYNFKNEIKTFFGDFKKFISKGNIVDMAVGVIIGGAFSAIVTALTNKILMPLINLLLSIGGENGLEKAYTFLRKVYASDGTIDLTKSIYIDWGAFITAIINFFIIAFVLFLIIRAMMRANMMYDDAKKFSTKEYKAQRKAVKEQAKQEGRKFREVWAEYEERLEREKTEKEKIAEANKPKIESQEDILKDIRALLQAQVSTDKKEEK